MSDLENRTTEGEGGETPGGEIVEAPKLAKSSWLDSTGDLTEVEIDVPAPVNDTVVIRALSAFHLSQMQDKASTLRGEELKFNSGVLKREKFRRGVIEPEFTEDEVVTIARKFGPAFDFVVSEIDKISEASDEKFKEAKRRFRPRR